MLALLLGVAAFLAISAGLFVPLEAWFPIRRQRTAARAALACAGLLALNTALMQLVGAPLLAAVKALVGAAPASLPRALAVVALADVLGYWTHRAMHRVPALWRLHAVHHAPTELSWLEAWRQHPVDFVLHGLAVGLPGALLGASLSELAAVVVLRKLYTSFLHANLRVRLGALERVLASPAFHRVHHSADPGDHGTNYAGTFALVDRVFGTFRAPQGFPARLGLSARRAG
jgi:sterol desaturase/sphingolipid hydroxylase (fatty acid hydroxylase superfamily)